MLRETLRQTAVWHCVTPAIKPSAVPCGNDEQLIEIVSTLVPLAADGCTIDLFEREGVLCVAAVHVDPAAERALFDVHGGGRTAHNAQARATIASAGEVVGEVVAWGEATTSPLGEALVCSAAAHVGSILDGRRALRRAQAAEAGREAIVALVGHEVRAPLQALTVGLELVQLRAAGGADRAPSEWLAERCAHLARSLERLRGVADRLLDVSRLEVDDPRVRTAEDELGAIVGEVVARLSAEAEWAGCRFEVNQERPLTGRWDRIHLETVVENLLSNAMKYGAGERIDVALHGDDQDVRLVVRDQGCGIRSEDVAHVFDRFYRGVVPGHYPGLGLGLWIVKRLVHAHGGTITCESEQGSGATFTVVLPRDVSRADRVRGRSEWPREELRR